MRILSELKRTVALGILAIAVAGLSGCGGGGGGGSSKLSLAQIDSALANGNFSGSFDTPDRASRAGLPPTACTLQFNTNVGVPSSGVASFVSGSVANGNFRTYSADIQNIVSTPTQVLGLIGNFTFDFVNFTAGAPFSGTVHFAGTYITGTDKLTLIGSLTGKNTSNVDLSIPFQLSYNRSLPKIDLSGSYTDGTIVVPNLTGTQTDSWTGTFTATDSLHLAAQIPVKDPTSGQTLTVNFTGQNARSSFAGSFDAGQLNPILNGLTGQWYVETHDNGKTIVGAYVVLDSSGNTALNPFTNLPITGVITAKKGTSSGTGSGTNLKAGYYDGGVLMQGGNLRIIKLDVKNSTATSGHNGAMVIVTNSAAPNIGGRIDTITKEGTNVKITVLDITNKYSKVEIVGPFSGSGFTSGTFTGFLIGGGTETGTLDQLGKVTQTTVNMTGTWTGQVTGRSGTPQQFSGTFAQTGDELTITSSTPIGGVTVPPIHGYVAGNSFAGHVSQTLTSPIAGTFVADFDGDVDSTNHHFDGSFAYSATAGTTTLTDAGTFVATKS